MNKRLGLLVGIILLGLVAAGGYYFLQKDKPAANTAGLESTSNTVPESTELTDEETKARLQAESDSAVRSRDASTLLAAVNEFTANNNGKVPNSFTNGALTNGSVSQPVKLEYYKTVMITQGTQPALTTDGLILVTGATCTNSGATVSASPRSYVAQYMELTANGNKPACTDM